MALGNGSAIDSDAITTSVETLRKHLGKGVHEVKYRYTQHGQFGDWDGPPREARVTVTPGIDETGGFFQIQWWENGDYKYHYREIGGLEFRFGREEANADTSNPVRHFHPPSNLEAHNRSCIDAEQPPERVTLAIITTWWAAVKENDESLLNTQNGLP
jgi:hypothetical protein